MSKLRVGVVGVGYLGKFHAEKYAAMEAVDLVGVVDLDPAQAERVARTTGSRAYTDYRQLLGKVDAVSVVVPTSEHFTVSRDFLLNGSDVLIEKPMTTTLEEADDLIRCADARGRIIQVGHLERFNPVVVALKKIVGVPLFIESHRLTLFRGRGADVSVVLDLMIHDIDIILNLVKSSLVDTRASGAVAITDQPDIANARLEFESGCAANLTASRIAVKDMRKLRLFQPDGYISIDFANHQIIRIRRDRDNPSGPIPGTRLEKMAIPSGDALREETAAFVSAVVRRQPPEVTGKMGRDALEVALDINRRINAANKRIFG